MAAAIGRLNFTRSCHRLPCLNCLSLFISGKHEDGKTFFTGLILSRTATGSNFVGSISADFANPRSKSTSVGRRSRSLESDEKRAGPNLETEEYEDSDLESDEEEEFDEAKFKTKATNSRMAKPWTKGQKTSDKTVRPSKYLFRDVRDDDEERQWIRREAPVDVKSKASWYARQMVRLSRDNQIEKAHELLSTMKEERIQPTVEVFNILISAYAKAGKVRKAFNIFNEMKKRGLKPTCYTYSSLFTACTKSPMPEHALQRAEKVLGEIHVRLGNQDLEMHSVTYNAAMQAFTVCGNPSQAFEIYKEMKERNIQTDAYTYSSLLAACCHDQVDGPRMAFHVLEEMNALEIKPDIFIFNAVLKVMRDFKVFHQQQQSPSHVAEKPIVITNENENQFALRSEGHNGEITGANTNDNGVFASQQGTTENTKVLRESVRLENFFPGVDKFLQLMAVEDVHPDVRTFQLLLYLTTSEAEEEYLLQVMGNCNIAPDVTFYNTLVKRKALEGDLTAAKKHMQELEEVLKVSPTEKSFHTLACGCKNHTEGLKLLEEIKAQGVTPTQAVYGTLIAGAARRRQFDYLIQLLKSMTSNEVQPNDQIIEVLNRAHKLPLKMPYIPVNAHQRVKRNQKRRYMEQKGFHSFFIHWKNKVFQVNTATPDGREAENITRETELDSSGEEITFDHL